MFKLVTSTTINIVTGRAPATQFLAFIKNLRFGTKNQTRLARKKNYPCLNGEFYSESRNESILEMLKLTNKVGACRFYDVWNQCYGVVHGLSGMKRLS